MLRTSALLLSAFCGCALANDAPERTTWRVVDIVDGDTVHVDITALPKELNPVSIRLRGIDTPETGRKAKCKAERELADKATAFTKARIAGAKVIEFSDFRWDKYGGRIDAEIWVDGKRLTDELIAAKLARTYGGGERGSWCGLPQLLLQP